jgi:hypothetical protein
MVESSRGKANVPGLLLYSMFCHNISHLSSFFPACRTGSRQLVIAAQSSELAVATLAFIRSLVIKAAMANDVG